MEIKKRIRNKWAELEDESLQITYLLDDLNELDSGERSPNTTAVYMLLEQKLKHNQDMQMFFEKKLDMFKE